MASVATHRRRGRPAAASREQVVELASAAYLRGHRIDVQAIASELGLGRATIYRWFGSREGLIGEVLNGAATALLAEARRGARGRDGRRLLAIFDRFNRLLVDAPALRSFVESERDAAIRVITSGGGTVQPYNVELITAVIDAEIRAGRYRAPVEPATLGYAVVRLAEAFLFNDAVAGIRGDVDRLRDVEAALLGVDPD